MNIDVSKEDIISLIKGSNKGGYTEFSDLIREGLGDIVGAPNERWQWNDTALRVRTEQQLYDLYKRIQSWD